MKILILFFLPFCGFSQGVWVERDSVNGDPRGSCISFVLEGEAYVGMGRDFLKDKRSLYSYDPFDNDWDREQDLGGASGEGFERSSAIAFTIDRKSYVGTGKGASAFLKDFWEFDPSTRTWSQKANVGGLPRRQAVAFAIDSFGYVGTGETDTSITSDFWKYNPTTNEWSQLDDFTGGARREAIAFTADGKGYIGTGNNGVMLNDLWQYSPEHDAWTKKSDFPGSPRHGAVGFAVGKKGYIATGYDNTQNYKNDVWEFGTGSNTWIQKNNINAPPRAFATAFVLRGTVYIGTGFNGKYLKDFYSNESILSTPKLVEKEDVTLYPSIATTHINIYSSSNQQKTIHLFSMSGQLMLLQHFTSNHKMDISNLSKGTYTYMVSNSNVILKTGKIVVVE